MVTLNNYEEYMATHADGELQPLEEEALRVFLQAHPHLKSELLLYGHTVLVPDLAITYVHKAALLKPEPKKTITFWLQLRTTAIAAGIAAILVAGGLAINREYNSALPVALKQPVQHTPAQDVPPITASTIAQASINPTAANTLPLTYKTNETVTDNSVAGRVVMNKKLSRRTVPLATKATASFATLPLQAIPLDGVNKLNITTAHEAQLPLVNLAGYELPGIEIPLKKSWLDNLPIDDLKKQSLVNMGEAIATGYEEIANIKKNVTSKSLTIKVEKRKLILSF